MFHLVNRQSGKMTNKLFRTMIPKQFYAISRAANRQQIRSFILIICIVLVCLSLWSVKMIMQQFRPVSTRDVFIYASFYYENNDSSISILNASSQEVKHFDTVAILILANREDEFPYLRCATNLSPRTRKKNSHGKDFVPAQSSRLDYTGNCQLVLHVIWCHLPPPENNIVIGNKNFNRRRKKFWLDLGPQILADQAVRDKYLNEEMAPTLHKILPKKADAKPRKLVMCISRLFAFEKWQLFVAAMETYKSFAVDLVVIHVYSAIVPVFKLMRAYEKEGYLAIREGVRLPFLPHMAFDPERELEYSGQLAMAHECFYEFRASAEFIALVDLDDLVVSINWPTIGESLIAATHTYPNAPYFYISKLESAIMLPKKSNKKKVGIYDIMPKIFTKRQYNSEKMVVRPQWLHGFWVHFSRNFMDDNLKPIHLPPNDIMILHLSKEINETEKNLYQEKLMDFAINESSFMTGNKFIQSETFGRILPSLPSHMHYFDAIQHCAKYFNAYPALVQPPPCLSYSLCQLNRRNKFEEQPACIVSKTEYTYRRIGPAKIYYVHLNTYTGFFLSKAGCFDEERGSLIFLPEEDEN